MSVSSELASELSVVMPRRGSMTAVVFQPWEFLVASPLGSSPAVPLNVVVVGLLSTSRVCVMRP